MKNMFVVVVALVGMLVLASIGEAAVASWTQDMLNADNSPLTDLAGFNLYETTGGPRVKVNSGLIPVSSCTGTTSLSCNWTLPAGVAIKNDTFVLTAVDSAGGESADSNVATFKVLPKAPAVLIIH